MSAAPRFACASIFCSLCCLSRLQAAAADAGLVPEDGRGVFPLEDLDGTGGCTRRFAFFNGMGSGSADASDDPPLLSEVSSRAVISTVVESLSPTAEASCTGASPTLGVESTGAPGTAALPLAAGLTSPLTRGVSGGSPTDGSGEPVPRGVRRLAGISRPAERSRALLRLRPLVGTGVAGALSETADWTGGCDARFDRDRIGRRVT